MQRGSSMSWPAHTKRVNTAINNIKLILVMALTHHEELGVLAESKLGYAILSLCLKEKFWWDKNTNSDSDI